MPDANSFFSNILSNIISGVLAAMFLVSLGIYSAGPQTNKRNSFSSIGSSKLNNVKITAISGEPSTVNTRIFKLLTIIVVLFTIGFTVFLTIGAVSYSIEKKLFSWDIFIFVLFFYCIAGYYIYVIYDLFVMERKIKKGGSTKVAKTEKITITTDYASLTQKCLQVLADMECQISNFNYTTGIIIALLGNDKLTIEIHCITNNLWWLLIKSDSTWPIIKVGEKRQLKNINNFINRLMLY